MLFDWGDVGVFPHPARRLQQFLLDVGLATVINSCLPPCDY